MERASNELMAYVRQKLKNYSINLEINVNDDIEKQYAFSPQEKYEKLKEKNPDIELLRKTFGLDV